jgi:hypothetical protein
MTHPDPLIAKCGNEVLRVMHEERVGVSMALFHVLTQRELYPYSLFDAVKKAVIDLIDEYEELRNMIVFELKTDRGRFPPTPIRQRVPRRAPAALPEQEEGGQMNLL